MDYSWYIKIPPKLLYTLTLRTVVLGELFIVTLKNMIQITPLGIHVYWCLNYPRILLWSLPTRHSIIWLKEPSNSTLLGNFCLTIFLIRSPEPRAPPPSKRDPYKYHYYRLSHNTYIPHISEVTSKSPIEDQFTMDQRRIIYVAEIDN